MTRTGEESNNEISEKLAIGLLQHLFIFKLRKHPAEWTSRSSVDHRKKHKHWKWRTIGSF